MIYNLFLPGLLFSAAYRFSVPDLRKNAGVIGMLSTAGLLFTALLLGIIIYDIGNLFWPISFIGALVVAAILTPTDPVSVVSILKQSTKKQSTAVVVDGESMINDGTSVVLFGILTEMYIRHTNFHVGLFLGQFLYVSIGGAVLGILVGWLLSKLIHITDYKNYQVMLSIITAYGVFELAEHLGFSGVLATVAGGIMLSWELDHTNREDHYREALSGFWDVVEPSLITLVYLLIGIEAASYMASAHWGLALIVFAVSLIIRFFVVSIIMQLFRGWCHIMDWRQAVFITWSGIRGTMSVFLLLSLRAMAPDHGQSLLSLAFAVVVLSLVVQSMGIYPLAKWIERARNLKPVIHFHNRHG